MLLLVCLAACVLIIVGACSTCACVLAGEAGEWLEEAPDATGASPRSERLAS